MDPTNERRVFELLVKHSSDKANSQYFLLSPKVRKQKKKKEELFFFILILLFSFYLILNIVEKSNYYLYVMVMLTLKVKSGMFRNILNVVELLPIIRIINYMKIFRQIISSFFLWDERKDIGETVLIYIFRSFIHCKYR
jgi:hypothetical protein